VITNIDIFHFVFIICTVDDESVCSPLNSDVNNQYINLKGSSVTKYIKSPLYPNKYPSKIECIWYIKVDWSNKIRLKLKNINIFNYGNILSCNSSSDVDSLVVYDGSSIYSSKLTSYCSSSSSSTTITSSGSYLTIRFKTNKDNYFFGSTAGFQAEYTEIAESTSSKSMVSACEDFTHG